VNNPGNQVGEVSVAASRQLTAAGGAPPVTWSGSGLPTGLAISSSGLITGTPSAAGTYSVQVSATDGLQLVGTAGFTWTVNALPLLVAPADQATAVNTPVSLAISRTGGTAPLTWSVIRPGAWGVTGLPPGLSLDPATGVISGTPTTPGPARPITVTVTDSFGRSASTTFTWTISSLQVQTPAARTDQAGQGVTPLQIVAAGGTTPYEWSATGLPPGLAVDPQGKITGSPSTEGVYTVIVRATDATGATASTNGFRWTVE
jgi:hypothetical protein